MVGRSVRRLPRVGAQACGKLPGRQRLRENERQFRHVANSIPQIAWTTDAQGRVNYFNDRREECAGASFADAEPDAGFRWVHPDDAPAVATAWAHALASTKSFELEARFLGRDGLDIAKQIVETHGGHIFVDPLYTGGRRFVVELPRSRALPRAFPTRHGVKKETGTF